MLEAIGALLMIAAMALAAWDANNGFSLRWGRLFIAAVVVGGIAFFASPAKAHDPDHPELAEWYATRKQPDTGISCCGPSDAYWCNEGARGSQVTCVIDDDRDDKKLNRLHVPNGTVIDIPPHKFNKDPNPTGRAVVWLSPSGLVWCFVGISGS